MPLSRPHLTSLLAYITTGLTVGAIVCVVLSISTTHWIHTVRIRAGLWKLCQLQPLRCYASIARSSAALSLTGLSLVVIGLLSTIVFNVLDWRLPSSVRATSLLSACSLAFGSFFFTMSCVAFSRVTAQFCYSYYMQIVGQLLTTGAAIVAGYLEGRRHALQSTTAFMTRLAVRRP